jgi:LmbE family N-acetylglucosaminyl deacetylase
MSSALCLVAHPDDETILCGGTLALLAHSGVGVHVVCLTRGEGGEMGEPPLCTRDELGQVREREMACAVHQLGCQSLAFLGYVDPVISADGQVYAPEHDPAALHAQLLACLRETGAQVVLTHGSQGEYGHPAHRLVHAAALRAVAALGAAGPLVYSFAAHHAAHPYPRLANARDLADVILDISPSLPQKEAAALCHVTQNALFVRRRSEAAGRRLSVREVLLTEESFRCQWPPAPPADDVFRQWVASATLAQPERTDA